MPRLLFIVLLLSLLTFSPVAAQELEAIYLPVTLDNIDQLQQIAVLEYDLDETRKAISQLTFHPTQPLLFSQEFNETVRIWDMEQLEFIEALPLPTVYSTAFAVSPDGENLLYGGWDFEQQPDFATLNLWNYEERKNKLIVREDQFNIEGITYNRDGLMFAAYGWHHNGAIRLWSSVELDASTVFPGHGPNVYGIAFTADNRLITTGEDREVRIWNVETPEIERVIEGLHFVLHPSEPLILVVDYAPPDFERVCTIYDLEDLAFSRVREFQGTPFAFDPTGTIVAVLSDTGVWLHNFESGERLIKLRDFATDIIAFSPDGRFIAVPSEERRDAISIWAIPDS